MSDSTRDVQKWGNSQGLRLSKEHLAEAHINVGDSVEVVRDGSLVIELVKRLPDDYEAEVVEWGAPVGREEW
ncbi:MAG: hypothetical protein AUK47_03385 [Deltaproteobacteria bacterium CG2_30_63_29]|nr:MAG: hypothetical protein AUK47_03385 [Deltaproteobacteria bacterium CG2_30_63_29]